MQKISVLTNNSAPNSRAFNTPLIAARPLLHDKGFDIVFHLSVTEKIFKSGILFINSNFYRTYWKNGRKDEIFSLLEKAKKRNIKVFWFDTTDSTWVTQFEVLPYVDSFLKSHVLKDRKQYLKNFRTGRIFTDFFDDLYQSGEKEENYPPAAEEYLAKIAVSWTPCFEYYNENRYSLSRKIGNVIQPWIMNITGKKLQIEFTEPERERPHAISARFGLTHSRPSVVAHRKAVAEKLKKYDIKTSRIPLPEYFEEMRTSQVSVSPFGVGEFCYRDYESIICGAALLKPDMNHLETWPDLYQENKTYIPHKWDLSDFNEKVDYLLKNSAMRIEIAQNAQKVYKQALSPEGMEEFAERVVKTVKSNQ